MFTLNLTIYGNIIERLNIFDKTEPVNVFTRFLDMVPTYPSSKYNKQLFRLDTKNRLVIITIEYTYLLPSTNINDGNECAGRKRKKHSAIQNANIKNANQIKKGIMTSGLIIGVYIFDLNSYYSMMGAPQTDFTLDNQYLFESCDFNSSNIQLTPYLFAYFYEIIKNNNNTEDNCNLNSSPFNDISRLAIENGEESSSQHHQRHILDGQLTFLEQFKLPNDDKRQMERCANIYDLNADDIENIFNTLSFGYDVLLKDDETIIHVQRKSPLQSFIQKLNEFDPNIILEDSATCPSLNLFLNPLNYVAYLRDLCSCVVPQTILSCMNDKTGSSIVQNTLVAPSGCDDITKRLIWKYLVYLLDFSTDILGDFQWISQHFKGVTKSGGVDLFDKREIFGFVFSHFLFKVSKILVDRLIMTPLDTVDPLTVCLVTKQLIIYVDILLEIIETAVLSNTFYTSHPDVGESSGLGPVTNSNSIPPSDHFFNFLSKLWKSLRDIRQSWEFTMILKKRNFIFLTTPLIVGITASTNVYEMAYVQALNLMPRAFKNDDTQTKMAATATKAYNNTEEKRRKKLITKSLSNYVPAPSLARVRTCNSMKPVVGQCKKTHKKCSFTYTQHLLNGLFKLNDGMADDRNKNISSEQSRVNYKINSFVRQYPHVFEGIVVLRDQSVNHHLSSATTTTTTTSPYPYPPSDLRLAQLIANCLTLRQLVSDNCGVRDTPSPPNNLSTSYYTELSTTDHCLYTVMLYTVCEFYLTPCHLKRRGEEISSTKRYISRFLRHGPELVNCLFASPQGFTKSPVKCTSNTKTTHEPYLRLLTGLAVIMRLFDQFKIMGRSRKSTRKFLINAKLKLRLKNLIWHVLKVLEEYTNPDLHDNDHPVTYDYHEVVVSLPENCQTLIFQDLLELGFYTLAYRLYKLWPIHPHLRDANQITNHVSNMHDGNDVKITNFLGGRDSRHLSSLDRQLPTRPMGEGYCKLNAKVVCSILLLNYEVYQALVFCAESSATNRFKIDHNYNNDSTTSSALSSLSTHFFKGIYRLGILDRLESIVFLLDSESRRKDCRHQPHTLFPPTERTEGNLLSSQLSGNCRRRLRGGPHNDPYVLLSFLLVSLSRFLTRLEYTSFVVGEKWRRPTKSPKLLLSSAASSSSSSASSSGGGLINSNNTNIHTNSNTLLAPNSRHFARYDITPSPKTNKYFNTWWNFYVSLAPVYERHYYYKSNNSEDENEARSILPNLNLNTFGKSSSGFHISRTTLPKTFLQSRLTNGSDNRFDFNTKCSFPIKNRLIYCRNQGNNDNRFWHVWRLYGQTNSKRLHSPKTYHDLQACNRDSSMRKQQKGFLLFRNGENPTVLKPQKPLQTLNASSSPIPLHNFRVTAPSVTTWPGETLSERLNEAFLSTPPLPYGIRWLQSFYPCPKAHVFKVLLGTGQLPDILKSETHYCDTHEITTAKLKSLLLRPESAQPGTTMATGDHTFKPHKHVNLYDTPSPQISLQSSSSPLLSSVFERNRGEARGAVNTGNNSSPIKSILKNAKLNFTPIITNNNNNNTPLSTDSPSRDLKRLRFDFCEQVPLNTPSNCVNPTKPIISTQNITDTEICTVDDETYHDSSQSTVKPFEEVDLTTFIGDDEFFHPYLPVENVILGTPTTEINVVKVNDSQLTINLEEESYVQKSSTFDPLPTFIEERSTTVVFHEFKSPTEPFDPIEKPENDVRIVFENILQRVCLKEKEPDYDEPMVSASVPYISYTRLATPRRRLSDVRFERLSKTLDDTNRTL